MKDIIVIKDLYKSFKDVKAVNGISFSVEEGSLFTFLGINGAGKSTVINILCSILKKDSGEVIIDGYNIDKDAEEIKKKIGIVFQDSVLDKSLTVKDNLVIRASYYGLRGFALNKRLEELTELFSLKEILNRTYGTLSGGQRRRVDIARSLLHSPKILFLDEPTTGLDPQTRLNVWKVIESLRTKNHMSVFLTTHYMEEADKADKVVIIDKGEIIAVGSPNELKNIYSGDYIKLYVPLSEKVEEVLVKANCQFKYENEYYKIRVKDSKEALTLMANNKDLFTDFEVIKGDMDNVFLNATGKKLGGEDDE